MLTVGALLILLGVGLVIYTNKEFLKIGRGTLAPTAPPKKLVVAGVYKYVRNPMIIGVLMIILGEALIFASIELFVFFVVIFSITYILFIQKSPD